MTRKPLEKALKEHFESINLCDSHLLALTKMQRRARHQTLQKYLLTLAACLAFVVMGLGGTWYHMSRPNSHELAMWLVNQQKSIPLNQLNQSLDGQQSNFYRLNTPLSSPFANNPKWQIADVRHERIGDNMGIHMLLKHRHTGQLESIYQAPYQGTLKQVGLQENRTYEKAYGSKKVLMFVKDNMFYAMTASP